MPLIKRHPRCGARTRSGRRCRRYVAVDPWTKKLRKRCRNHGGLSTGPKFADGKERSLAAANAGLARWRERMRAAKAAGLIAKFPCGRKPGPSRRQRELAAAKREEELARARAEREEARRPPPWPARRGGSSLVIGLERLERHFIARLADRDPPPRELIEEVYTDILRIEDIFGRAVGKEERLACVGWAYHDWREREALKKVLAELAQERAARAAQTSAPASEDSGAPVELPEPSPIEGAEQVGVSKRLVLENDAEATETARLTAEATELIAAIKARYTESGGRAFDAELARARDLVRSQARAEGVEVTERALRVAEIDLCRRRLEMIRVSQAGMDALKARLLARSEWRDRAKRDPVEWDGPMTMPR